MQKLQDFKTILAAIHLLFKIVMNLKIKIFKNFMAPFYGWGSTASRLEPLRGGSLLFTTNFPEIRGTYFIDLGRMTLEPPSGFEHGPFGLGILHLNHRSTSKMK